jgi:lipopolysaccharide biosynthesis protein
MHDVAAARPWHTNNQDSSIVAASTLVQGSAELVAIVKGLTLGDEFFWTPDRLVPFEHWAGHIPFAFWIVKVLRPRRIVELGTHRGNSYGAFCQAIATFRLDAQAFAVDTWAGDVHMGQEDGLLENLREYHDPRYGDFSTLLQMTFDEARSVFEDGCIDLLHLDGTHTYEAVRHDFETWRTALSPRAVVLFHDTVVRRDKFGVWRLWTELSGQYRAFEFQHSYGLGVLGVGPEQPDALRALFAMASNAELAPRVRSLFAVRGSTFVTQLRAASSANAAEEARLTLETEFAERIGAAEEARLTLKAEFAERIGAAEEARLTLKAEFAERIGAAEEARLTLEAEFAERIRAADYTISKVRQELDAAQRSVTALRDLVAAERNVTYSERQNVLAMQSQLAAVEEKASALRARLAAIEQSTTWRALRPILRALSYLPPSVRHIGRHALRAAWWTVTLRIPARFVKPRQAPVATLTAAPRAAVGTQITRRVEAPVVLPDLFACRSVKPRGRIGVVAHVHFPEVWHELENALRAIDEPFDLFVSVTETAGSDILDRIRTAHPEAFAYRFPNHGRDILPFLAFAGTGALNHYEFICKLHTKCSIHLEDGDRWRRALVNGILGEPETVQRILAAFDSDPDLGIVVADGNIYGQNPDHWRDNRARVLDLGSRIGVNPTAEPALFPGGSIYWIRPFLLRTLVGIKATAADFDQEPLPLDGTAAHAIERIIGLVCADAGMRIEEVSSLSPLRLEPATPQPTAPKTLLIANYLPQFHPIPENDAWWGKGFTEWSNVARANPQFRHHRQPRLPADLGFYDLRLKEVREAQAELARAHGISGFCYYYYWFNGRGILRLPLEEMIATGRPDFPFLLCWANEPWSRNWDGGSREVLLPQDYADGWPETFARDIAPILADRRYVRLDGRPVLLVYRVMHIPEALVAFARLRAELRRLGVGEIHLGGGWVGFADDRELPGDPTELGLDAFFEFPPHRIVADEITGQLEDRAPDFSGHVYSYDSAITHSLGDGAAQNRHRAVMLGWDNTARVMQRAHVFHGATPAKFRRWLRGLLRAERTRPGPPERLVFINAWNEWAEGASLEPDQAFGLGWLEAVVSAAAEPLGTN